MRAISIVLIRILALIYIVHFFSQLHRYGFVYQWSSQTELVTAFDIYAWVSPFTSVIIALILWFLAKPLSLMISRDSGEASEVVISVPQFAQLGTFLIGVWLLGQGLSGLLHNFPQFIRVTRELAYDLNDTAYEYLMIDHLWHQAMLVIPGLILMLFARPLSRLMRD